jgi:hypothetical protein
MEYARDIVDAMDLQRMEQANTSFGKFLKELKHMGWCLRKHTLG